MWKFLAESCQHFQDFVAPTATADVLCIGNRFGFFYTCMFQVSSDPSVHEGIVRVALKLFHVHVRPVPTFSVEKKWKPWHVFIARRMLFGRAEQNPCSPLTNSAVYFIIYRKQYRQAGLWGHSEKGFHPFQPFISDGGFVSVSKKTFPASFFFFSSPNMCVRLFREHRQEVLVCFFFFVLKWIFFL